ncbi:MAG: CHASE domain-containing protein [Rhodoferax sp.]
MSTSASSKPTFKSWAALGMGLLLSILASLQVKQAIENDVVKQFAFACDQVTIKIQERLAAYALILRGAAALFAASDQAGRQQWHDYVETLIAAGSVPGVQGIGFSQLLQGWDLDAHTARIRSEGFPDYAVRPPGERAVYTPVVYLEPFAGRNLRAFGFDMFSEPVRRRAMELARDTGVAALSGKVELVQETDTQVQAGTLMYVPVYRNRVPLATVEQRRAALIGWTYSPYRMKDLMTGILHDWVSHDGSAASLNIYDGSQASPDKLLYDSKPEHRINQRSLFYQQRSITFNGHPWQLAFDNASVAHGINYAPAWATLIGGVSLSAMLFWLILALSNTRATANRIATRLTEEIRNNGARLAALLQDQKAILENDLIGIVTVKERQIVWANPAFETMLHYESGELAKTCASQSYLNDEAYQSFCKAAHPVLAAGKVFRSQTEFLRKDGAHIWVEVSGSSLNQTTGESLWMFLDITERRQMEDLVRQMAFYDVLTKLPNRRLLMDRLSQTMAVGKRKGRYGALLFLDLDNFKSLNDAHGHEAGDLLLLEVANRLRKCVREIDTVSRFGGDEFVVLLSEMLADRSASIAQAGIVAEKIRTALAEPYLLTIKRAEGGTTAITHHCTASVGVVVYIDRETSQDDILKWADAAMYKAKDAGRNLVRFHDLPPVP